MMDPVAKQEWLDALRSKEYKQARAQLCKSDGSMCCLGVLYDVAVDGAWQEEVPLGAASGGADSYWGIPHSYRGFGGGSIQVVESTELPTRILNKLHIDEDTQSALIGMNDVRRYNFTTIAKWIEKNL